MDPDQTLADIRTVLRDYFNGSSESHDVAFDLADLVDALDEWLSKGGFLPAAWDFPIDKSPEVELLPR